MANIKQQKKRVHVAARQHAENLRYRSTIKTLFRRLQARIEEGDAAAIDEELRGLQKLIDRAAARNALHANTASRKKARAARLVAAGPRVDTGRRRTRRPAARSAKGKTAASKAAASS